MQPVSTDDGRLYYTEVGSGDPVVLVHGGLSDAKTWQGQLGGLSREHRVIAYTRRPGQGARGQSVGPDQMAADIEDLAALVERLDLAPVHLVGHSWGAFVCLWLSIRRPDLVRSLVLAEPPFLPFFMNSSPKPQELIRMFAISPGAAIQALKLGKRGFASPGSVVKSDGALMFARTPAGLPAAAPNGSARPRADSRDNLEALRAEFLANNFGPLSDQLLQQVRVPVLLVTGRDSPAFLTRFIDRLERLLPDIRRVTIGGASHYMHEDNPDAFNQEVVEFWARQTPILARSLPAARQRRAVKSPAPAGRRPVRAKRVRP